jgi:hypothetical protein
MYERAMIELRDAQRDVDKAQSNGAFDRAMERREKAIAAICALVDGDDATRGGA